MEIESIIKEHTYLDIVDWLPAGFEELGHSINESQLMAIESI